jgi:hypothetical protein
VYDSVNISVRLTFAGTVNLNPVYNPLPIGSYVPATPKMLVPFLMLPATRLASPLIV